MYITDALSLTIVPRWAIVPTIRPQSVAEHSFSTAIIVQELFCRYGHMSTERVRPYNTIFHALNHDIEECVTGDIPRHAKKLIIRAKRDIPEIIADMPNVGVNIEELSLVKLADIMEAATWIRLNGIGPHARAVAERMRVDLRNFIDTHEIQNLLGDTLPAWMMYEEICDEKGRANATGSRLT